MVLIGINYLLYTITYYILLIIFIQRSSIFLVFIIHTALYIFLVLKKYIQHSIFFLVLPLKRFRL